MNQEEAITMLRGELPEEELIEQELQRIRSKKGHRSIVKRIVALIVVMLATCVILGTIFMPIIRLNGNSMAPTISEGQVLVALKGSKVKQGDIVAFYVGNMLLVKRIIAGPGQTVMIDEKGNVYVDGELLEEAYISTRSQGEINVEMPVVVPEGRFFVMGDHRESSVDSRNVAIGCIGEEQIVGRVVLRVWPFSDFGIVK